MGNVILYKEIRKIIIFDLDYTLIYCSDKKVNDSSQCCILRIGKYRKYLYIREGIDDLIKCCRKKGYDIGIWSSGEKNYVFKIVKHIFRNHKKKPELIYTRDDCQKNKRGSTKKDLSFIIGYPINKILLVEDNINFVTHSNNCLLIPKYKGNKNDKVFFILNEWISNLPKDIDFNSEAKPIFVTYI